MRRYITHIILNLLLISALFSQWRGYDVYRCGAKGLAMGGAFTAVANDVSAIYFNPAGLIQMTNFSIFYTMDAQLKIHSLVRTIRPELKITYKVPALVGFVYPLKNRYNTTTGFAIYSTFQRKIPYEFAAYKFAPLISTEIMRKLAVGVAPGLIYSTYIGAAATGAWGFNLQLGILYKILQRFRVGLNYSSKIVLKWQQNKKETLPDIFTIGASFLITEKLIGDIDMEYQNWKSISYIINNEEIAPVSQIETGLFKTIHPHLGVMFLEEKTGAHMRTGIFTDSFIEYVQEKVLMQTQLLWSIGVGAYAFKIVKIEAVLVDSYLMHFINDSNNRIETIQITIEYRF